MTNEIIPEVRQIVASAIGAEPIEIEIDQPFLEMGASSIALVDAFRVIYERFGVRPSVREVFEKHDNVTRLATYVAELIQTQKPADAARAAALAEAMKARQTDRSATAPLTPGQTQLSFLARYSSGASLACHEAVVLELEGPLDREVLQTALDATVARHESLRTVFDGDAQRILPEAMVEIRVAEQDPRAALEAEMDRPLPLDAPLLSVVVIPLEASKQILVLRAHALIADRRGLRVLAAELAEAHDAAIGERAAQLPDPVQLRDLAQVQSATDQTDNERYWVQHLAGMQRLELPGDHARPPVKSYAGARVVVPLSAELQSELRDVATRCGTSLYTTVLGAFNILVARLSGQRDVVIGTFAGGEALAGADRAIANLENPLALRTRIEGGATFGAYLDKLQGVLLDAFDHRDYPFASLVAALDPERDQSRSPVFTVAFDRHVDGAPPALAGLPSRFVTEPRRHARYDLELTLVESQGGAQLVCDYSTDLFEARTVRRWLGHFKTLLASLDSGAMLDALPLMTAEEADAIVRGFNDSARTYEERSLLPLIDRSIAARPDAVAITADGEDSLTYAELDRASAELAGALVEAGVEVGDRVGVLVERGVHLPVALIGVLRAGAAYVPLDPEYPQERLRYMVDHARTRCVVTGPGLSIAGKEISVTASGAPTRRQGPTAYVIYTSGSTGRPKGTSISAAAVANLAQSFNDTVGLTHEDVVLALTSISFDVAVSEIFGALAAGARLDMARADVVADAVEITARADAIGATYLQATASGWKQIIRTGWHPAQPMTLGTMGEACPQTVADDLTELSDRVWNLYGPTETTVYSAHYRIMKERSRHGPLPIGRPLHNQQLYIVDDQLRPCPVGVVGQLLIGGAGLADGYFDATDPTAESFVDNPFGDGKVYCTGDFARWTEDGDVVYLGRGDQQVKIHGVRVELEEIERHLVAFDGVREAAVVTRPDATGDLQLVGYFTGDDLRAADLQSKLRAALPNAMVPLRFSRLERMPLTPNGKLDKGALPKLDAASGARDYVEASTPTEQILAKLWSEVLSVERVGANDDFFDLGGHSLLMTELMIRLRHTFSMSMSMREFFEVSQLDDLARFIDRERQRMAKETVQSGLQRRPSRDLSAEAAAERTAFLDADAQLDERIQPGTVTVPDEPRVILLTGATGFVGTHMIDDLLDQCDAEVRCMLRDSDADKGLARLAEKMAFYQLWREDAERLDEWRRRVTFVHGDLSKDRLGMSDADYARCAAEVDLILHSGAHVNFLYPYPALRPINVLGTRRMIELACHGERAIPLHYISTAAIWPMGPHRTFTETDSIDHGQLLNLAYDEAKWVAEKSLERAAARGLPVTIYRPGEVGGNSKTGQSVIDHFAVALLKGGLQIG